MDVDTSIPVGAPDELARRLVELRTELEEGEITVKGYNKRREQVLELMRAWTTPASRLSRASSASGSMSQFSRQETSDHSAYDDGSEVGLSQGAGLAPVSTSNTFNSLDHASRSSMDHSSMELGHSIHGSMDYGDYGYDYDDSVAYGEGTKYDGVVAEEHVPQTDIKLQRLLDPRGLPAGAAALSRFDSLPAILRHRAVSNARRSAIVMLDSKGKEVLNLTWEKLAGRAERVAQLLRAKSGLFRGDRVTLIYQDSELVDFVTALLGCFLAGMVAVPVLPSALFRDIVYVLGSTQSHLALTTDANLRTLQKTMTAQRLQWPKGVEWNKTNDLGSFQPAKRGELPALQVPDLAYIEFARSPLGELRGVVLSHRTVLHQMTCLAALLGRPKGKSTTIDPASAAPTSGDVTLCNLDIRQSIGLIVGVLYSVYAGNTLVWMPQACVGTGGLYAHIVSKYRTTILLSDYPTLKTVAYDYQQRPNVTRNFSRKTPVDFKPIRWCLIDSLTVDTAFHEVLTDRWLRPLGNKDSRNIVAPLLTLGEHGGMVVAMKSALVDESGGDDLAGDSDLAEVALDAAALAENRVVFRDKDSAKENVSQTIVVGAFGRPLPDATLAVVNPETRYLSPEGEIGELWIDSPSLSGGFWGLTKETDTVFRAACYDLDGAVDLEFLRTGLLGFVRNGRVYVLGLYEDRLRQRVEKEEDNNEKDEAMASFAALSRPTYRYHYTAHLVQTVMRTVPRAFDACAFDILVNGEHLPVLVVETSLPSKPLPPIDELAVKCKIALLSAHMVRVYCVLVAPANTLPRIVRCGRPEIGSMLCKRRFLQGALQAIHVRFGDGRDIGGVAVGVDPVGGIWSPMASKLRASSLGPEKQYSGVDFRDVVLDERRQVPLSDFKSIVDVLRWRISNQPEELAYSTIDGRGRESRSLSWRKLASKVAGVVEALRKKHGLKVGDAVILMLTHSEDYVVAVWACLVAGLPCVPMAPLDVGRLTEDVPALLSIVRAHNAKAVLVNAETEPGIKSKQVQQQAKGLITTAKAVIPPIINTAKIKAATAPTMASATSRSGSEWIGALDKRCLEPTFMSLYWLNWTADHRPLATQINHASLIGMCKIQKETCQLPGTKPMVGCVRSTSGIGFLHTCVLGAYIGSSTLLVSPIDYAANPATFFATLGRHKVKDAYSTPQMLDHACALLKPRGFSLNETANLVVATESRPSTELVTRTRVLFAPTGLESVAIAVSYSHGLNPMVATRSYMALEPVDLWLDRIALRHGYVSIVNPENCPGALHVHDSGMVPVCTQIVIVNPETRKLCRTGEYGEIWVFSEGNVSGFFDKSDDGFSLARMHARLNEPGAQTVEYVRTGDLGFLHTIVRDDVEDTGPTSGPGQIEMQTLFVLGSLGESIEVLGLSHFVIDLEHTIEHCHKAVTAAALFQAGGYTVALVEIAQTAQQHEILGHKGLSLAALVPVIVNSVLNEHQLVLEIVAFVGRGNLMRSRLGEKQRGKMMAAWVKNKLDTISVHEVARSNM